MSERLHPLLPDDRLREVQRTARRRGLSVGACVRRVPDAACRREPLVPVDEVLPIESADAVAAKGIVLSGRRLSARDAIHLAVMRRHKIDTILSFDRAFDGVPGITRLGE